MARPLKSLTFTRPVTLKVAFYAQKGELISTTQTITFDSQERDSRNREKRLKFDLTQNAGSFNNQTISLVMKKVLFNSSEEPLFKETQAQLKLSFFNEFDEF